MHSLIAERERLLQAERDHITQRVLKIIELKKKVCDEPSKHFVVINQNVSFYYSKHPMKSIV